MPNPSPGRGGRTFLSSLRGTRSNRKRFPSIKALGYCRGMNLDGCFALVTGASAGLGREFARQLAPRARGLVLVARRGERLHQLRDDVLSRDPNLVVHVRIVDLRDQAQIEQLTSWLEQEKIDIDLLINNAGLGDVGPFATSD